jgi:hypothetical protein
LRFGIVLMPSLAALTAGGAVALTASCNSSTMTPFLKSIPGNPTDAQLIAKYPAADLIGYTATTSDLGPEKSDGTRWLILSPPVPPGAAAAGYTKLIYAIHPVEGDINFFDQNGGPNPKAYFVNGYPGVDAGENNSFYNMTNGQLTLVYPEKSDDIPSIMAAQTYHNDYPYDQTVSALTPLAAGSGYYIESANTTSVSDGNNWGSFWIWTYEGMTSNESHPWVELDINEWGFHQPNGGGSCGNSCGTLTSLIYWTGLGARSGLAQLYSPLNLDMTRELVIGAAWDAKNQRVVVWENGSQLGAIPFASTTPTPTPIPVSAWSGYHHFPLFGAASHNATGKPAYNYSVRYVMAWGPP